MRFPIADFESLASLKRQVGPPPLESLVVSSVADGGCYSLLEPGRVVTVGWPVQPDRKPTTFHTNVITAREADREMGFPGRYSILAGPLQGSRVFQAKRT